MTKVPLYEPVEVKCFDWSKYKIKGFFTHRFNRKGKITNKVTFMDFNGDFYHEVMGDKESVLLIAANDEVLSLIKKRKEKVKKARSNK